MADQLAPALDATSPGTYRTKGIEYLRPFQLGGLPSLGRAAAPTVPVMTVGEYMNKRLAKVTEGEALRCSCCGSAG